MSERKQIKLPEFPRINELGPAYEKRRWKWMSKKTLRGKPKKKKLFKKIYDQARFSKQAIERSEDEPIDVIDWSDDDSFVWSDEDWDIESLEDRAWRCYLDICNDFFSY